jgi:hypothetical protein
MIKVLYTKKPMNTMKRPFLAYGLLLLIAGLFHAAMQRLLFNRRHHHHPCRLLSSKMPKPEDKAQIFFQIAECYQLMTGSKQAEVWYCKAIKSQYKDPMAISILLKCSSSRGVPNK